jgi:hypothetical protein
MSGKRLTAVFQDKSDLEDNDDEFEPSCGVSAAFGPAPIARGRISPTTLRVLGVALQAHFDDIARSPFPDRVAALLSEIEAKERRHG